MSRFDVEIRETNKFEYTIYADNKEEAKEKALKMYEEECKEGDAQPYETDTAVIIDGIQ